MVLKHENSESPNGGINQLTNDSNFVEPIYNLISDNINSNATQRNATQRNATQRNATQRNATQLL